MASAIPVELAVLVPALLRNHGKHGLLLKSDLVLLLLLVLRSFSWWTAYIVLRPIAPRLAERELMVGPGLLVDAGRAAVGDGGLERNVIPTVGAPTSASTKIRSMI